MTTAWSGGQYSVLRVLLAGATASLVLDATANVFVQVLAVGLGAALALGFRDRPASLALAALAVLPSPWASAALVTHAALPPAPYGSWEARGRLDPGDAWQMPPWVSPAAWAAVVAAHVLAAATSGSILRGVVEVGLVAGAIGAPTRRWAWLALTLFAIASGASVGVLVVHAFAFDPGWLSASTRITPAIVFYDGACGLCHRAVRFILAEDGTGVLRLAPLASGACDRLVPADLRATLPDSLVVRTRDGELLVRSRAVIEIGCALGGLWRAAATLLMFLPTEFVDQGYDFVAARRRRLFGPPAATCPLVPPRLRGRFLDDGDVTDVGPSGSNAAR